MNKVGTEGTRLTLALRSLAEAQLEMWKEKAILRDRGLKFLYRDRGEGGLVTSNLP